MDVPRETPDIVRRAFPDASSGLVALHDVLATEGVTRGLIGPREVPRLWDRHLLNCAVVGELMDPGAAVADVGSGAGLPGLVLALVRPDLRLTLVEPLERRCTFLAEVVECLDLGGRVEVVRGRAEDIDGRRFRHVTARAVAPLDQLAQWCLPLVEPLGSLLAIKGERAGAELDGARASLPPGVQARIVRCGQAWIDPPTTVVVVDVGVSGVPRERPGRKGERR